MAHRVIWIAVVLASAAAPAATADRFAVLEFFGRPAGAFCSAAGPAMFALQDEFEGSAVLLEYDYDQFQTGRLDRFWATGASAPYLPLVMVGSGFRTSSGSEDYERIYRSMLQSDMAREPEAAIAAWWRRRGDRVRAYIRMTNTGSSALRVEDDPSLWLVAYEEAPIGVSSTWVRSTTEWFLPHELGTGESITATVDSPPLSGVGWNGMAAVVMAEQRPGGVGAWDVLQAASARPAEVDADPASVRMGASGSQAVIEIDGPHVLTWSAVSSVPWLAVEPAMGSLPGSLTIMLHPNLRPPTSTAGTITISAIGDGMSLTSEVQVEVGAQLRRAGRRIRPAK